MKIAGKQVHNVRTVTGSIDLNGSEHVYADTAGGPVAVGLPTSPVDGDMVRVYIAPTTDATNTLTIDPRGRPLDGTASALVINAANDRFVDLICRGGEWTSVTVGSGGNGVTVSTTAPTSPAPGDLWFDSDRAIMFIWFNDGTDAAWVDVSGFSGSASGASVTVAATAPLGAAAGDLWFDSVNLALFVLYVDGAGASAWIDVSGTTTGGGGATVDDLNDLIDVDLTGAGSPTNGSLLRFNGTVWRAATLNSFASINDMIDVDTVTTPPVSGNVLAFNGTQWAPAVASGGGGGAPQWIKAELTNNQTVAPGANVIMEFNTFHVNKITGLNYASGNFTNSTAQTMALLLTWTGLFGDAAGTATFNRLARFRVSGTTRTRFVMTSTTAPYGMMSLSDIIILGPGQQVFGAVMHSGASNLTLYGSADAMLGNYPSQISLQLIERY